MEYMILVMSFSFTVMWRVILKQFNVLKDWSFSILCCVTHLSFCLFLTHTHTHTRARMRTSMTHSPPSHTHTLTEREREVHARTTQPPTPPSIFVTHTHTHTHTHIHTHTHRCTLSLSLSHTHTRVLTSFCWDIGHERCQGAQPLLSCCVHYKKKWTPFAPISLIGCTSTGTLIQQQQLRSNSSLPWHSSCHAVEC